MSLQNFLTFREVCSLDGSSIKVVGTPIPSANNFRVDGNSPFDLFGTKKNFIRYKELHASIPTCIFGPLCDKEIISEEV